jgi:hypothetical protein
MRYPPQPNRAPATSDEDFKSFPFASIGVPAMGEINTNYFPDNPKSRVNKVICGHHVLRVRYGNGEDFVVLGAEDGE